MEHSGKIKLAFKIEIYELDLGFHLLIDPECCPTELEYLIKKKIEKKFVDQPYDIICPWGEKCELNRFERFRQSPELKPRYYCAIHNIKCKEPIERMKYLGFLKV